MYHHHGIRFKITFLLFKQFQVSNKTVERLVRKELIKLISVKITFCFGFILRFYFVEILGKRRTGGELNEGSSESSLI